MGADDELGEENEALREHDLPQDGIEVEAGGDAQDRRGEQRDAESARALTGASYGAIATVDHVGEAQDFVTSGFTPEQRQRVAA